MKQSSLDVFRPAQVGEVPAVDEYVPGRHVLFNYFLV